MNGYGLMVGDWVMRDGKIKRVDSIKGYNRVWLLDPSKIWGHRYLDKVPITEVQPIPLTPEILQKNGFHFGNTTDEEEFSNNVGCGLPEPGWCYDEGGGEIKIIFPNGTDGGLVRLDDGCYDRQMEFVFVNPIMVHELQHILRLCGIEKEVTL